MERRLIIMRHAKSAWDTDAESDHARPLSGRGRRDAPRVAAAIAALGWCPTLALSSDSLRTRQTFEHMHQALGGEVRVHFTRRLYHAGLDAVQEELENVDDAARTVMVVGHNPGWEELLLQLCGRDLRMTTANAALLSIHANSWRDALSRDTWALERLLRPKEL